MFLVDLLRPRVFVELGTHWGYSYCAFCQAVQELQLPTRCYAVDTWRGDPHAGTYGPEVLADLRAHHDPLYGSFSRLIESTFDDALDGFGHASIDLLHIDGLHTYEAVKHDFEAWSSKLSGRGVVAFHDINARRRGYGVWKLWEELATRYQHFALHHAHGFGVVAIGPDQPNEFRTLLETPSAELQPLRDLFFVLGHRLRLERQLDESREKRLALRQSLDAQKDVLERKLRVARGERDQVRAELEELQRRWPVRVWLSADAKRRSLVAAARPRGEIERGEHSRD